MIITTDSIDVLNDVLDIARESKIALHNRETNMWEITEWNEWFNSVIDWNKIDGAKVAFEDDHTHAPMEVVDYPVKKAKEIIACREHVDLFLQALWSDWLIVLSDVREIIFCKIKNGKKHIIHRQWDDDVGMVWTEFYIVEPEKSSLNVVLDENIHSKHERVTPMEEGYDDE